MKKLKKFFKGLMMVVMCVMWFIMLPIIALPLLYLESVYHEPVIGSKILVLLAVRKCMKEQYEKEN